MVGVSTVASLLAAGVMLVVAVGLLMVDRRRPAVLLMALYLAVLGGTLGTDALAGAAFDRQDEAAMDQWSAASNALDFFWAFVALALIASYPRVRARGRLAAWLLGVGAFVALLAWAVPELLWTGSLEDGLYAYPGPLVLLWNLVPIYSILAYFYARAARREAPGPTRLSLTLLAVAFIPIAGHNLGLDLELAAVQARDEIAFYQTEGIPPVDLWMLNVLTGVTGVLVSVAFLAGAIAIAIREDPDPHHTTWMRGAFAASVALFVTSALSAVAFNTNASAGLLDVLDVVDRALRLGIRVATPLLVAYAVLKFQLFGLDLGIKSTLRRSAFLSAFALVFWLANEVVEQLMPGEGLVMGLASAGIVSLGFRPIERVTGRFADRLFPGVARTPDYDAHRRRDVYRAAFETCMEDAIVTPRERAALDRIRTSLHMDETEAAAIEADVLTERAAPPPPQPPVALA